jgi:phosphonopyruvate decarboxylase
MLNTNKFVKELENSGYTHLCVVPCSFAKNFINSCINNPNIEYIASASEAVAISIASGLKLSGAKPIVIVQSSGLTNMGSAITSMLKPYNITLPIITSWRTYKEGDSEVQHKHLATKLPNLIEAYGYDYETLDQNSTSKAISQIENANKTQTIIVLQKDTFAKVELEDSYKIDLSNYPKRSEYLKVLNEKYKNSEVIFIGTTGNTAREIYSFMPKTKNFYMVGNMGGALSLGVGMAKAGKKVFVLGGDAEFVMHMGGVATAGRYKELDLTYIVFDNHSNKSTGGQATFQEHLDYIGVAKSCGMNVINETISSIDDFKNVIKNLGKLNFIYTKCDYDEVTPRPPVEVVTINRI